MSSIAKIAAALVAAQSRFRDPVKDAKNPHFKSMFVTLKGVLDAVRPALHEQGISIVQEIDFTDSTMGPPCFVRTRLLHSSGESIESRCPVICVKQNDPQAMGSAITYARRYGAAAICGVAPADEDDDAEEAAAPPKRQASDSPKPYDVMEEATTDIASATNALRLDIIAARMRVSKFSPTERDAVLQAWQDKKKQIKEA